VRTYRLALLVVAVFGVLSWPSGAWPQLIKLNVTTSGVSPTSFAGFLAKETGIFTRNGLDVQVVYATSTVSVMGLLSEELSIIEVAGPTVIRSSLRGGDLVFVAGGVVTLNYWLMSGKNIKTAEQLKGGILGSSDLTGSSFIAIQFALGKLGLSEKDVAIIRSGGTRERLAALRGRRIQATVLSPPTSFMAQNEGFNLLTDVTGMPFQHNGVVTTRRIIRQSPDLVRRYVKSQVEAVHLMKTDRETGIKVLMKFMRAKEEDREVVGRSYDLSVGDDVYPRKQYPTLAGIKTILDAVAKEDPKAAQVKPDDFVDVRFIRELDQSGFIDNLYKGKKS